MKKLLLLSVLFTALLLVNCGDDDGPLISEVVGTVFEGTAANGFEDCGWLIDIDGTPYVPNVLNSQFRQEGLSVFMKVEFLEERVNCSISGTGLARLRIEQIRLN